MRFRLPATLLLLTLATFSFQASADTSARGLIEAIRHLPDNGQRLLALSGTARGGDGVAEARYDILVHTTKDADVRALGLTPISKQLAVGTASLARWNALLALPEVENIRFAPARAPFLDVATVRVEATVAHEEFGLKGEGSIVGVVDTGIDAFHPSFLHADGSTRIAWFLAYGMRPLGTHPELEELYECTAQDACKADAACEGTNSCRLDDCCAIYSRSDINEILQNGSRQNLPKDSVGHGTHVASLAAGDNDTYPGVAPLSDLVIVQAADQFGSVTDARILLGTKFVFDRAQESQQPSVVNISLGSSFGAHDGTSTLEQGLAGLASGPGRAVVVASGNSGELRQHLSDDYPAPFGIHTETSVTPGNIVRVPFLTPHGQPKETTGSIYIWISTNREDFLSLGFHNGQGSQTDLIEPGKTGAIHAKTFDDDDDDYEITIINGVDNVSDFGVTAGNAVLIVSGSWQSGRVFELVFEGSASAKIWATGLGEAGAAGGGGGPLFPRARTRGTVAIPASHPDLISVGSTFNRTNWTDYTGEVVGYPQASRGTSAFSAVGPNQSGDIKPEISAPGGSVIAAMAQAADPRDSLNPFSLFSSYGGCPTSSECFVVDDEHAVSSGTSMSAPQVSGAVALLMQRDPSLTMREAKGFLMSGANSIPDDKSLGALSGAGQLDVVGALMAQERSLSGKNPVPDEAKSRVVWADSFLRPAPAPPLQGYLLIRDAEGRATDGDLSQMSINITGPASAEWQVIETGLVEIFIQANEASGSQSIEVEIGIGGEPVSSDNFEIALDPILAEYGFELAGGACHLSRTQPPQSPWLLFFLSSLLLAGFKRRHSGNPAR